MDVTIRRAERRDVKDLGRLGAMLMRAHYAFDPLRFLPPGDSPEEGYGWFLGTLLDDPDSCVLVAENDGVVVGYLYAALEPMSWKELRGPAGFIHDVGVSEEARRSGVASELMRAGIEWLREKKAPRVVLWTATPNSGARELFEKLGFRETMREMTLELNDPEKRTR